MKRWVRRLGLGVVGVGLLGGAALASGILWLRTDAGNAFLAERAVQFVNGRIAGTVSVGALETDLWSQAVLRDVTLAEDGVALAAAKRITLRRGGLSVDTMDIEGMDLDIGVRPDGQVPWLRALSGEMLSGLPVLEVRSFSARGRAVLLGHGSVEALSITGAASLEDTLRLQDLAGTGVIPGLGEGTLTGWIEADGTAIRSDLEVHIGGSDGTLSTTLRPSGVAGTFGGRISLIPMNLVETVPVRGTLSGSWEESVVTVELEGASATLTGHGGEETWRADVVLADFKAPAALALHGIASGSCTLAGRGLMGRGDCELAGRSGSLPVRAELPLELSETGLGVREGQVFVLGGQLDVNATVERGEAVPVVSLRANGRVPWSGLGFSDEGSVRIAAEGGGTPDSIEIVGTASGRGLGVFGASITDVSAPFTVQLDGDRAHVQSVATLTSGTGFGLRVDRSTASLDGEWDGLSLRLSGPVRIGALSGDDLVATGAAGSLWGRVSPGHLPTGGASLQLEGAAVLGVPTTLKAELSMTGSRVGWGARGEALRTPFELEGELELVEGRLEVRQGHLEAPQTGEHWVLAEPGLATVSEQGVAGIALTLDAPGGSVRLMGEPGDLQVVVQELSLGSLRPWVPGLPASGRVSGQGVVRMRADEAEFSGSLLGEDLGADGISASLRVERNAFEGVLAREGPIVEFRGRLPARLDGPLDAEVTAEALDLGRFEELGVPGHSLWSGQVRVRGPLSALEVSGGGRATVSGTEATWTIDRVEDRLQVSGSARAGDAVLGHFEASAAVPIDALGVSLVQGSPFPSPLISDLKCRADLDGLSVATVANALGVSVDVDGQLHGTAKMVDGIPNAELELRNGRLGTVQLPRVQASLSRGTLDAEAHFLTTVPGKKKGRTNLEEGAIHLEGVVPLNIEFDRPPSEWIAPADIRISGRGLPLGLFSALHPTLHDGMGWVSFDGRVAGTPLAPDVRGVARLEDGALTVRSLGLRAVDIRLEAALDGDVIDLVQFSARTQTSYHRREARGKPSIFASGSARLSSLGLTALRGQASLRNAKVVARRDQHAWLSTSAPLEFSGEWPWASSEKSTLMVSGDLIVNRARVALDKPTLMEAELWDGPARSLDPRLRVLDTVEEARLSERPFWFPLAADLSVDLGPDCEGSLDLLYFEDIGAVGSEATTLHMEGSLLGRLDLSLADGEANVEGQVDVVRGAAVILLSTFTIDEGSMTFVDGDPYRPFVDVDANLALEQGGDVDLHVEGTPSAAKVEFSSATLDPDQVLASVVTGQHPSEVTGADALEVAFVVVLGAALGDYSLGTLEIRQGMFRLPLALGPRLRATPALGFGNGFQRDFALLQLQYLATTNFMVGATLGNATQVVGFTWAQRF